MTDGKPPIAPGPVSSTGVEGAPDKGAEDAPLTRGELKVAIAEILDEKLGKVVSGLQRGSDKQIAQTRAELQSAMTALAQELGVSVDSVVAASGADDETKQAITNRLQESRQAARAQSGEYAQRMAFMENALAQAGLAEDDLPHELAQYVKHPDPAMFNEALRKATAKKPPAQPPASDEVKSLKTIVAELEKKLKVATGEEEVPEGGTGTPSRRWERPEDVTPADVARIKKQLGLR